LINVKNSASFFFVEREEFLLFMKPIFHSIKTGFKEFSSAGARTKGTPKKHGVLTETLMHGRCNMMDENDLL
jgi:hypothetical protein